MKAAVVTSFDHPPRYEDFAEPEAPGPGEMLVEVLAVGLHRLTLGRAAGRHYSSTGAPPLVAGFDGVGRGPDGTLRYFVQSPERIGTLADKTVIETDRSIALPADANPVDVAAAMNPAMAAWLALRCRLPFQQGQKILIIGATGSSGGMAVQIARYLGASQIIAAGRDENKLAKLRAMGATEIMQLDDARLAALANEVDVVLDFVWGDSAVRIMGELLRQRANRAQALSWIHVGSMGGEAAAIPGAYLRSAPFQIVGSGLGSVSGRETLAALPALVKEITNGTFRIDTKVMPLSELDQAWAEAAHSSARIVLTP